MTGIMLMLVGQIIVSQHEERIVAVSGEVPPENLGVVLVHEHILVDFVGADKVNRDRYDRGDVFTVALPHLERLKGLGCQTLVECTPAYIGRDPVLLMQLAKASGLNILTNTGYYGAANDKFVPNHAFIETDTQLAARWVDEANRGIENTDITPGFIKIGVDAGNLSDIDAKLVRAAALTHKETGLTIAAHTGNGIAAMQELDILDRLGVESEAFIWVHAQNEPDTSFHLRAAERGAWVEFDGIKEQSLETHVDLVMKMIRHGELKRTLISQDAGWYHVGEPDGGNYRGYDFLFTRFVPALKEAGATEADIRTLLIDNPREALLPRVRTVRGPLLPD